MNVRSRRRIAWAALVPCLAASVVAVAAPALAGPACTRFWVGRAGTAWTATGNWSSTDGGASGASVPGNVDVACMSSAPASSAVTIAADVSVNGIKFGATFSVHPILAVHHAKLTVNSASSVINNLTLDSAVLAGAAPLSITGTSRVTTESTIVGPGTKTLASGAYLTADGPLDLGNWDAGTCSATSVATSMVSAGTLVVNAGVSICSSDDATHTVALRSSGTLELNSGITEVNSTFGLAEVVNSGLLTVPDGYSVEVHAGFANTGTVQTGTGSLLLARGNARGVPDTGVYSGSVEVAFTEYAFSSGGSIGGELIDWGVGVDFATGYPVSDLVLFGATIKGSPTVGQLDALSEAAPSVLSGGTTVVTVNVDAQLAALTVGPGAKLRLASTAAGKVDTSIGELVVDGRIENAGSLAVVGDGTWQIRQDAAAADSGIENLPGSSFAVSMADGNDVARVDVPFTGSDVTVGSGYLALGRGNVDGTADGGTWRLAAGTQVAFMPGTARAFASGSILGPGSPDVDGATVDFGPGTVVENLYLTAAGTVTGSPTLRNFFAGSGTISGGGHVVLTGNSATSDLTVAGATTLQNTGTFDYRSSGDLTLNGGSVLENSAIMTITGSGAGALTGDGSAGSEVLNDSGGAITATGGASSVTLRVDTPLTNDGTVTAGRGRLRLADVTNLSARTLSGGTWIASGGRLALPSRVTTNNATIVIGGAPGSAVLDISTGLPALRALADNAGSLTIATSLSSSVVLRNKGQVSVAGGATFATAGYTQDAGSTTVSAGSTLSGGVNNVELLSGTLTGSGSVTGTVYADGATVQPGTAGVGTLTVGSYKQSTGRLKIVPTRTALNVTGSADLAGTLAIISPSPLPALGASAEAITAPALVGAFATTTGRSTGSSHWTLAYLTTGLRLKLVAGP